MDSTLSLVTAFVGGVLMFLAPCTLPLVPAFIISLIPLSVRERVGALHIQRELTLRSLLFTIGFTVVFVCFGVLVSIFGSSLSAYKTYLAQIGGVIIILFGLSELNVITRIPFLESSLSHVHTVALKKEKRSTALILGVLFGLGWAPCAGPILASILLLASQTATILQGSLLLFVFSLGLAIPFMIVGFLFTRSMSLVSAYGRFIPVISVLSGILLILLGLFLVFGQFVLMTHMGMTLFGYFGYVPMCYMI